MAFDPEPPFETGVTVTMTGSATVDLELSVESYEWVIRPPTPEGVEGDEEPVERSGETVDYAFEASGNYEIELRVTGSVAQTGAVTTEVIVERGEAPEGYVRLTGVVEGADGEGAAPGMVEFFPIAEDSRGGRSLRFDVGESGEFVADVPAKQGYLVGFMQAPTFPADGVPDFYAVGAVQADESRELPPLTLREAHPVSIRVVDEEGSPVTERRVEIGHHVRPSSEEGSGEDRYDDPAAGYNDVPEAESSVEHSVGPVPRNTDIDESGQVTFDTFELGEDDPTERRTDSIELVGSIDVYYETPDGEWWRGVTTTVRITVDGDDPGLECR